ncbi:MAG: hypothetical protein V4649_03830 [Bacteroidota bacterium]
MTPADFTAAWNATFPGIVPIQHLFKTQLPQRWFRIHSLPDSKRYPETPKEWQLLLDRHNTIITDIMGAHAVVLLVTGDYNSNEFVSIHIISQEPVFKDYSFQLLDSIDLGADEYMGEYDPGEVFRPAMATTTWRPKQHDKLLRAVADDELRFFFVSFDNATIVAPYDGGIDIILQDIPTRDFYKDKYRKWLSAHPGGL